MKYLVIGVVVVFVGYWMVQEPASLAAITQDALSWTWDFATGLFVAVIDFTKQLLS